MHCTYRVVASQTRIRSEATLTTDRDSGFEASISHALRLLIETVMRKREQLDLGKLQRPAFAGSDSLVVR